MSSLPFRFAMFASTYATIAPSGPSVSAFSHCPIRDTRWLHTANSTSPTHTPHFSARDLSFLSQESFSVFVTLTNGKPRQSNANPNTERIFARGDVEVDWRISSSSSRMRCCHPFTPQSWGFFANAKFASRKLGAGALFGALNWPRTLLPPGADSSNASISNSSFADGATDAEAPADAPPPVVDCPAAAAWAVLASSDLPIAAPLEGAPSFTSSPANWTPFFFAGDCCGPEAPYVGPVAAAAFQAEGSGRRKSCSSASVSGGKGPVGR
mmetsp:Transcript_21985/g.55412  ORF Transcript_21985/g.55412 Transcript_21985/m.55412 type:complete len:268 (-) Transcript_21985:1140-1943(-)